MTREAAHPDRARWRRASRALTGLALTLLASGAGAGEQWGWLGVRIRDISEQEMEEIAKKVGVNEGYGVLIAQVMKETPAASSGLREGDLVVAIDGRPIVETRALQRLVGATPAGRELDVVVLRESERQEVRVRVGRMPADVVADRVAFEFGFYVRDAAEDRPAASAGPEPRAPVVAGVAERSSAAQGGLRAGDRILAVNGVEVDTIEGFRARVQEIYLHDSVRLRVDREGERLALTLPPAQPPSR
ncbi:MAG TPA: PDZ domain-containing protein [Methylomirabilota bacterium]|jgi:serine protease Do